jgi:orotate phosphoribosyltransferase
MKKSLIGALRKKGIVKYGTFTLKSGIISSYYCDIKQALGYPELLSEMVKELIKLLPSKTTCVAGSGYGGITLASLVSYKMKLPLILVRDKIKDHGTKKVIDGYVPTKKDFVCIIDDVFTTGSSIAHTKERLIPFRVKFVKPVVVLNRSKSKTIFNILSDKDLSP